VITDTLHPIPLQADWLQSALLLSQEAGWNQTEADWSVFFRHGTVLGFTIGGRLVATAAALPYGNHFGWVSMVLVTAAWRRKGLAHRLMEACTSLLRESGRAALLDAAPAAINIYAALGYVPLCRMERWEGVGGGKATVAASANLALDRLAFGADRRFLLDDFVSRPGSRMFESPHGFAVLRQGSAASQIGPIVAEPEEASVLVTEAIRATTGSVVVDVLDAGRCMIPKLMELGFQHNRSFTRMAFGLSVLPGHPAKLLAAAGPEFG
jgi:GNAT superfamily N-acetyltransferase